MTAAHSGPALALAGLLATTRGAIPTRGLASSGSAGAAAAATAAPTAPGLAPGAVLECTKCYTPGEVSSFVALTGDTNAIHTDAAAAAARGLPGTILPGLLMAALFPAIIGSTFPGALYLSQTLKFKHHALVRASWQLGRLWRVPAGGAGGQRQRLRWRLWCSVHRSIPLQAGFGQP